MGWGRIADFPLLICGRAEIVKEVKGIEHNGRIGCHSYMLPSDVHVLFSIYDKLLKK